MATINVRKETSKLYIDFRYRGVRCREQTRMSDTAVNRRELKKFVERMNAEITLDRFDYAKTFPESKRIAVFANAVDDKNLRLTFGDFAEIWLAEMKPTWRSSYYKTISYLIASKLVAVFGKRPLNQIKKAEILKFRSNVSSGSKQGKRSLSASYVNRLVSILVNIIREASDRFGFSNPGLGIKPLRARRRKPTPFSIEEVEAIIGNCPVEYKNYFIVRFFSGLRTGELHGLRWTNVCFKSRTINVIESMVDGVLENTKSAYSDRTIEMSDRVFEALKRAFSEAESEYVFARNGQALTQDYITQSVWYPLLKRINIAKRRPYSCRHTAASLWLASGENPEWISRQLGHKSSDILFQHYSNYIPNLTRSDGQEANKLFNKIEVNI